MYRNGNLSCCKTLTLEIIAKDQGEPPKERSIIIKILPQQHSQHTGGGGGHTGAHSGKDYYYGSNERWKGERDQRKIETGLHNMATMGPLVPEKF